MRLQNKSVLIFVSFVVLLLVSACVPQIPAANVEPDASPEPSQPAGVILPAEVLAAVANVFGLLPEELQISQLVEMEWSDSCLGLGMAMELCMQAVTPGYGGQVTVGETQYEFRTDMTGQVVRLKPLAAQSARQSLAFSLGITLEEVILKSIEAVEWPNACLGVEQEGEMCAEVITPGYKVILEAGGQEYELHTDENGITVVGVNLPSTPIEEILLVFEKTTDGACQTGVFYSNSMQWGVCQQELESGDYVSAKRNEQLAWLVSQYAAFETETPTGKISFGGLGEKQATPSEQRMVAEWAVLALQEAQAGSSDPIRGLAFTWHQEGGIAGFCSDVSIFRSGEVVASNCKGSQPQDLGWKWLTTEQVDLLYEAIDRYASFEMESTDPATADALTIRMAFTGNGSENASTEARQALSALASQLFGEMSTQP